MKLFNFLRPNAKRSAAAVAKERLQIIVSHESARRTGPDIVKKLQKELLDVISKYIQIDPDQIKVQLERHGDQSILELNVTLPDTELKASLLQTSDDDASDTNDQSRITNTTEATKEKEQETA